MFDWIEHCAINCGGVCTKGFVSGLWWGTAKAQDEQIAQKPADIEIGDKANNKFTEIIV